ncbi:MAG: isochorismatase family cysteine hydrolase, partial [Phycisphaerae bacterium]
PAMQVMIVDMLEGFTRIGPLASSRVDALVPRQAAFLRALPAGSLVVFAADEHNPDDFELRRFPPHCLKGTKEAEIRAELLQAARRAGAAVEIVRKTTFSGFFGTCLDDVIQTAPSRSWVVIGCVTDCCIEANVAELVYRGRDVTVIRELVDTWDLSIERAQAAGRGDAHVHDAERINEEWLSRRLPAIWGVRVVDRWQDVIRGVEAAG